MKKTILGVLLTLLAGCASSGAKYKLVESVPKSARVGVLEYKHCSPHILSDPENEKVVNKIWDRSLYCTKTGGPKNFADTLTARLSSELSMPIVLVPMVTNQQYDYSAANVAEIGKKAGVDYIIGGKLNDYIDPSANRRIGDVAAKVGSIAVTAAMAAFLPVTVISDTNTNKALVMADIEVVRTSDAKIVGSWMAARDGGSFTSTSSLTEQIADIIAEEQFAR